MDLCLIREGLARGCTEAETAFAVQGLGSFPLLQSGRPEAIAARGSPRLAAGEAVAGFALTEPDAGSDVAALSLRGRAPDGEGYRLSRREDLDLQRARRRRLLGLRAHDRGRGRPRADRLHGPARHAGPAAASRIELVSPHPIGRLVFDGRPRARRSTSSARSTAASAVAMRTLDLFRPSVGAFAVGMAQAALDAGRRPRRRAPGVRPPAARTSRRSRTASPTSPRACRRRGCSSTTRPAPTTRGIRPVTQTAAMAKLLATEVAQEAVDAAIQIHGAKALERGHLLEHLYREVRAPRIYEGASEIQREIIARALFASPRTEARDEGRDHRRRPRRPVRRDPLQPARRGERGHRLGAQRAGRHLRLRRRLLRRDAHRLRGRRPADVRARSRAASPAGPTSTSTTAATVAALRRPRLLGAQPAPAAEHPAGAGRRARRRRALQHARRRRSTSSPPRTTSSSPPTASTASRATRWPSTSGRRSTGASRKFMWLGTDLVFEAFTFHIVETEYGVFQIHGYPYDDDDEHLHRRDRRGDVAAGRARRARGASRFAPGESDEREHRVLPRAVRRHPRRPHARRQQLALAELPHRPQRALVATRTSCCSATRRTPRTSRSARARSSRWRTRSRWPGRSATATATSGPRSPPTRTSAGRSWRARSAPRRRASSGSRASRRYVGQDAQRVRVQPAHAQPPHHLRQPARARRRVRRRASTSDFTPAPCTALATAAAPIPPMFLPFRLRDLELPNRVVVSPMDMYSRRRRRRRATSTSSTSARARVGGAGLVMTRDDLRRRRRAGSRRAAAGCTATTTSTAGGASSTSSTPHGRRASARSSATAGARARTKLMWEGMDEPLESGGWPRARPVAAALLRPTARCRAR